jgi:hypothetical protein
MKKHLDFSAFSDVFDTQITAFFLKWAFDGWGQWACRCQAPTSPSHHALPPPHASTPPPTHPRPLVSALKYRSGLSLLRLLVKIRFIRPENGAGMVTDGSRLRYG